MNTAILFGITLWSAVSGLAAPDALRKLPPPVASYAEPLAAQCRAQGLGGLVVNENYRSAKPADVNRDGLPDYVIYKCMFGCDGDPLAFEGRDTPCAWGKLLLSGQNGYAAIFLPGSVSGIAAGASPLRVSVGLPRALRLSGPAPYPTATPQHVYELKAGRFRMVGVCNGAACEGLLGNGRSAR